MIDNLVVSREIEIEPSTVKFGGLDEERCYVYIIETTAGAYKIGVAYDPKARHQSLKSGIPDPSHILHTIPCNSRSRAFNLEKSIHKHLDKYHSAGEWFKPPRDIIDNIILGVKTTHTRRGKLIVEVTQTPGAVIASGDFAGWPLLEMTLPLKEEILEIIHRVSNYTRRRPPLSRILERASWYGLSPEQVNPIISELKSERKIIELHPGLYRFP